MLRAVRLAAKLGVAIDPKTAAPIPKLAPLMQNVPPARLFDEMQKLLLSGHAVETLKSLRAHGLSHGLLPLIDVILEQPLGQRFIDLALADTDARVRDDRGVSPGFLFATLLWHEVLATWKTARAGGGKSIPALFDAMDKVLAQQAKKIAIPRRFEATIKEIWSLQPRFEQRSGQRPYPAASSIRAFAPVGTFSTFAAEAASSKASSRISPTGGTASPSAEPAEREAMLQARHRPEAELGAAAAAARKRDCRRRGGRRRSRTSGR